jgi:hypothetical protein
MTRERFGEKLPRNQSYSQYCLRLRGRGQMPEAKSGRVHILHQLAVPGGVAAEDTRNYFLLRLTRRRQRCRSGSEISRAGLYQRQGARGWCRSVEGCGIRDELMVSIFSTIPVQPYNSFVGSTPTCASKISGPERGPCSTSVRLLGFEKFEISACRNSVRVNDRQTAMKVAKTVLGSLRLRSRVRKHFQSQFWEKKP